MTIGYSICTRMHVRTLRRIGRDGRSAPSDRTVIKNAWARVTIVTWWCQPVHVRPSKWSSPSSSFICWNPGSSGHGARKTSASSFARTGRRTPCSFNRLEVLLLSGDGGIVCGRCLTPTRRCKPPSRERCSGRENLATPQKLRKALRYWCRNDQKEGAEGLRRVYRCSHVSPNDTGGNVTMTASN
jgi:hypothetical protein